MQHWLGLRTRASDFRCHAMPRQRTRLRSRLAPFFGKAKRYSQDRGFVGYARVSVRERWPHGSGPGPIAYWASRTYVIHGLRHIDVHITYSRHKQHNANSLKGSGFCRCTLTGYIRDAKEHDTARLAGSASPTRRAATYVSSSSSSSNAFSLPHSQP